MAVTVVVYSNAQGSGVSSSQTLTTQSVAAGDILGVIYAVDSTSRTPAGVSDDKNGAWTDCTISTSGGPQSYLSATAADPVRMAAAYKKNAISGNTTVTVSWSAGTERKQAYWFVVSGLTGGGDLDQCIGESYSAVTGVKISAGTFATLAQAAEGCGMMYSGDKADSSILSGWTRSTDLDPWNFVRGGSQVTTASTGFEAGWNKASSSLNAVAVAMSFKDASGGSSSLLKPPMRSHLSGNFQG